VCIGVSYPLIMFIRVCRLDLVQTFVSGFSIRAALRDSCLPSMATDLDRLNRRLFSGKASLQVKHIYSLPQAEAVLTLR